VQLAVLQLYLIHHKMIINKREKIGGFSTPVKPFDESLRHYNMLIFFPLFNSFINSSK